MRVHVLDEGALTEVVPRNIRLYLKSRGWTKLSDAGTTPDVWTLSESAHHYEVIAPSSREKRDFSRRVAEVLRTVSIVEERSELELLRDLNAASFDIQYVHTHSSSVAGTAPLRNAADIFSGALAMLSASTASLEEPRLVLPPRRSSRTAELMNRVLAGPTTAGSYIVSIWVPIPPRLTSSEDLVLFDDETEPFERRATTHLQRALLSTKEAINVALESDDGLEAFEEGRNAGVSANLCEALMKISGEEDSGFDVRFSWSLDRPLENAYPSVSFGVDSIPVLEEAARLLRTKIPEDEVRIRGNVVRLHRETKIGSGEVTIAGSVVGDPSEKLRRVALDLAEPDYQLAIQAHETFGDVEVVGSLIQRGNRMQLRDARGFSVTTGND